MQAIACFFGGFAGACAGVGAFQNCPQLYDGLAEVWYESYDDFLDRITSADGKEAGKRLREDEKRFAQIKLSRTWWSEVHEIL